MIRTHAGLCSGRKLPVRYVSRSRLLVRVLLITVLPIPYRHSGIFRARDRKHALSGRRCTSTYILTFLTLVFNTQHLIYHRISGHLECYTWYIICSFTLEYMYILKSATPGKLIIFLSLVNWVISESNFDAKESIQVRVAYTHW